jgi:hypothetical protein
MHIRTNPALAAVPAALLAASVLLPTGALAHEHRDIDSGKYTLVVGWDVEPAIQGQPNAATVRVASNEMPDMAMPVSGAERTLQLTVRQGDMTAQLPLRAVDGKPGSYAAAITPDRAGDYQWTLSGSINGDSVDEMFDTADGKFDAVKPAQTQADAGMPAMADTTATTGMPGMADATASASTPDLGQLSASLDMLDGAGLHGLDGSISDGAIPDNALVHVQQAQMALGMVAWPAPLQASEASLSGQLDQLSQAIQAGDTNAAMAPAHEAHEMSHEFASQARAWLAAQGIPSDTTATGMQSDMADMDHGAMSDMAMH